MELTGRQVAYADAGLTVMARDGAAAVSFRTVAAEAGMSLGAVQKAFGSKEQMLHAMFGRLRSRAAAPAGGEPGRPTLRTWLGELTLQILPLDEPRRVAQLQGNAFGELALRDGAIAAALRHEDDALLGAIGRLVGRAIAEGEVSPDVDPRTTARLWQATTAGLAQRLLYAPEPQEVVRPLVVAAVTLLLPGPSDRADGGPPRAERMGG